MYFDTLYQYLVPLIVSEGWASVKRTPPNKPIYSVLSSGFPLKVEPRYPNGISITSDCPTTPCNVPTQILLLRCSSPALVLACFHLGVDNEISAYLIRCRH